MSLHNLSHDDSSSGLVAMGLIPASDDKPKHLGRNSVASGVVRPRESSVSDGVEVKPPHIPAAGLLASEAAAAAAAITTQGLKKEVSLTTTATTATTATGSGSSLEEGDNKVKASPNSVGSPTGKALASPPPKDLRIGSPRGPQSPLPSQIRPVSRGFSPTGASVCRKVELKPNSPPPLGKVSSTSVLGPNSYALDELNGMGIGDAVSESDSWSSGEGPGIGDFNDDTVQSNQSESLRRAQTKFEQRRDLNTTNPPSASVPGSPSSAANLSEEPLNDSKTFVMQLNDDLHPILEKYQCGNMEDLIKILRLYSQSVNNMRTKCGIQEEQEGNQYFSFRQFASWKLALSHEREEQMRYIEETRIEDNEESIFSELPLERDDHAETELQDWQLDYYVTDDQKVEQSIVEQWVKYSFFITFVTICVQLIAFYLIVIRCTFEFPATAAAYAMQVLFLDLPLICYAIHTIFAVREERGIFRVRIRDGAAQHIRSASFWIDVVGMFPMEVVGFAMSSHCTLYTNSCGFIAPYWQLNKLLLCRSVLTLFGELTDAIMFKLSITPSMGRIFGVFVQFAIVTHASSGMAMLLVMRDPHLAAHWLHSVDFFSFTSSAQYFQLMDWATKTIVGFAKGEPFDLPDEVLVAQLLVSILGIVIFATLISSVNNYLSRPSDFNKTRTKIDEAMDEMRRRALPEELVREVVSYYWHCYDTSGFMGKPADMLQNLPKKLQIKLMLDMGRQRVERVPMLANQAGHKEFVMCLSIALIPETLLPRTILFRKGDTADSMAFVIYGACGVVPLDYYDTHQVLFVIRPGSFFGEIALIVGGRRTATIASLGSWVNLLWLRRANFLQLAEDFPEAVHEMELKAHERLGELKNNAEKDREARLDALAEATNKVRIFSAWIEWQRFCDMKSSRGEFSNSPGPKKYLYDDASTMKPAMSTQSSMIRRPPQSLKNAANKLLALRKKSNTVLEYSPGVEEGRRESIAELAGQSMEIAETGGRPSNAGLPRHSNVGLGSSPAGLSLSQARPSVAPRGSVSPSTLVEAFDLGGVGIAGSFNLDPTSTTAKPNDGGGAAKKPGSVADREARPWSTQRIHRSSSVSSLYRQQHPGVVPYEPGQEIDD